MSNDTTQPPVTAERGDQTIEVQEMSDEVQGSRRTKRRYAHELYPHADEWETRTLDVEVPYRIARAFGFEVTGTSWFDAETPEEYRRMGDRMVQLINEARIALLAVALHKGIAEEMWQLWEAAEEYGVDVDRIKPYPCGPEPDHHDHYGEPDHRGWRTVTRVDGKESECPDCTEEVEAT